MKVFFHCNQCPPGPEWMPYTAVMDGSLYDVTCEQGHRSVFVSEVPKFSVLFDYGAMALLDGYCREAVTSMAAALERYKEFHTRVLLRKHQLPDVEVTKTWSMVRKQSERQLGAFYFLNLLDAGVAPPDIDKEKVGRGSDRVTATAFRNNVVHDGQIPSREDAVRFGSIVYDYVYAGVRRLVAPEMWPHTCAQVGSSREDALAKFRKAEESKTEPWGEPARQYFPTIISLQFAYWETQPPSAPVEGLPDMAVPSDFEAALAKFTQHYQPWLYKSGRG